MSLQLTPELTATVQGFLAKGSYRTDEEVVREALVALQQRDRDLAEILEGIEDETAGRIQPWREVRAELREKYGTVD
jgi:putative addiction module CopG family antidote